MFYHFDWYLPLPSVNIEFPCTEQRLSSSAINQWELCQFPFLLQATLWIWMVCLNYENSRIWSEMILVANSFVTETSCFNSSMVVSPLTHWGRVTHICVSKLSIIGSDNGLSPDRRQAIIWTNAGLLSIGPLWTYFNENLLKKQQFSLKKMHVEMSSAKWHPSCLGLNVLRKWGVISSSKLLLPATLLISGLTYSAISPVDILVNGSYHESSYPCFYFWHLSLYNW